MKMLFVAGLVAVAWATTTIGCGGKIDRSVLAQKPLLTQKPLFERLGGLDAVKAVVDELVADVVADPLLKPRFAATDLPAFKQKLVEQLCQASGGPCTYTGKPMAEAHAGMKISDAELDAFLVDAGKALARLRVPDREQRDLMALLGAMRPDVVGK